LSAPLCSAASLWWMIGEKETDRSVRASEVSSSLTTSNTNRPQNRPTSLRGPLVVGLYAWATAVSFGFVLLDIMYANLVPEATAAFSEVADFLLLVSAVTVLAALGAIGLSWKSRAARSLLLASLVVSFLGFFAPALLSPLLQDGSAWGAGIRMIIGGSISILAFMGFYRIRLPE